MDINQICNHFCFAGQLKTIKKLDIGNINSTYIVEYESLSGVNRYIVQKVNKFVFKRPDFVMENVVNVINYLKKTNHDYNLDYVKTLGDESFYLDSVGEYWRAYKYIENSVSFDNVNDL